MHWTGHDTLLVLWALVGIAVIVLLITWGKVHPFLALILGSLTVGLGTGLAAADVIKQFESGFGSTLASVGILVGLGTMLGKLLADSGGADQVVRTILGRAGERRLPWAMTLIAMIVGLPLFFEVGVVLLIPVIVLMARRSGQSIIRIGIPALAGLSVMHGLVPPHPGPLIAVSALKADLGQTIGFGILVAIPTVIVAGPLYGMWIGRRVAPEPPARLVEQFEHDPGPLPGARRDSVVAGRGDSPALAAEEGAVLTERRPAPAAPAPEERPTTTPSFGITLFTILLPVALMLAKALGDVLITGKTPVKAALDFVGDPLLALTISVLVAMFTFGYLRGFSRRWVGETVGASLAAIAGIVMIIGAGGGFKQMLIATGIGDAIGKAASGSSLSPLLLGWLIAVAIRLATGSATVATVTAAGLMAPIVTHMNGVSMPLLALAIGAGSLFFSHVNDAGFWLVKEYFGMSVGQTVATWSAMETILSVVGIVLILLLSLVI
ncbi:MAG: gluconate transporter [Actinobacteria bacterium]|nr:MAG: gluconate transporter [Actinomycetota bacterium]